MTPVAVDTCYFCGAPAKNMRNGIPQCAECSDRYGTAPFARPTPPYIPVGNPLLPEWSE